MTLTVETGAGVAGADALASLAYVDAYHSGRGNSAWTGDDADKETAIRRASTFLGTAFGWKGVRTYGRDQTLAWPRSGVTDIEGLGVDSDEIPTEIEQAVAEAALRELVTPGSLTPDYTPSERVSSETVGPLSVTYDLSRTDAESVRPIMLVVRDLVSGLLESSGASGLSGEAQR